MIKEESLNKDSILIKVLKGTLISIISTAILILIFSGLLTYTNLSENTIPAVTILITIISIFLGSTLSMKNLKKNGIVNGMFIGLTYILIIYLTSSIITKNFCLNLYSIITILGSIIAGSIGGIIAVNK